MITEAMVEQAILQAIANANLARSPEQQLEVSPAAQLFGATGSLDSLGLVALLIDVEEFLRDAGIDVTLSDERAVSQRNSPFRSVQTLTSYVMALSNPSE